MKFNKGKIFIAISVVFLLTLTIIYSYRLVYFYRLEHKPVTTVSTLNDVLTNPDNLVTKGDGLYRINGQYVFKGQETNNYLLYSGRLWRIMKVNNDNSVKVITDDLQTSLVWNYETNDYENSYIYKWLNPVLDNENSGIFYDSLYNPKSLLVAGHWCVDIINDINNITCKKTLDDTKVGLLEINDYKDAGAQNSYLNKEFYEWTISGYGQNQVWLRLPNGELSNKSNNDNSYYSYGVRPVINIKGSSVIFNGDGSKENPYIITENVSTKLADRYIGEYINYGGYIWRIISKNESTIKVVMNGYIKDDKGNYISKEFSANNSVFNPTKNNNIGYYLNKDFYNSLSNSDYIVSAKWNVGNYSNETSYNYENIYEDTVEAKIGLLHVGELFVNDFDSYALLTNSNEYEDTVYTALADGHLYADTKDSEINIRPAIYLDINLQITEGTGSVNDPFVVNR